MLLYYVQPCITLPNRKACQPNEGTLTLSTSGHRVDLLHGPRKGMLTLSTSGHSADLFMDYVSERSRCQHQATEPIYFTDYVRECSRCQHQATEPISLWTMLANAHVVNTRPLSQSTSRTMHGNAHVVNIRPLSQSTSRTTLGNAHVVNIRPLSQSASRTTLGNAHVVNIRPLSRSTSRTMLGMIKRLASRIYTLEYFCQYLYASRVTRFLLMNKFYSFVWSFIDANGRHFTARSLRMLFEDIPLDCITISLSKGDKHFWKVQSSGAVSKSRWTSWAPVSNKPTVSVDVKQHSTNWKVIKTKRTF